MKITVTIDEKTIKELIAKYVSEQLGDAVPADVRLLVKSTQNYRSTWETCAVLVTNDDESPAFKEASKIEIKAEVKN